MPIGNELTPKEAAYIATNSYFTLKDWIKEAPVAGVEKTKIVKNRVLTRQSQGNSAHANTSLNSTGLKSSNLSSVFSAKTGFGTTSGFGYTLSYESKGQKHVIIATRGTRPEMQGKPDLITDLHGTTSLFYDYGPVHKGFKKTFESILPQLVNLKDEIESADVIHCVGHSLGGAVATLIAGYYARSHASVKLYTFGSPRVGCFMTYKSFEESIGKSNIFRVAHDLDPITLIGPFPFIHVLASPKDDNNMTLTSPSPSLFSTENHDMKEYIKAAELAVNWKGFRALASQTAHDNALVCRYLLHKDANAGWVKYACAKTLALLFKVFSFVLKTASTALIIGLSAVDLLAEILYKGFTRLKGIISKVYSLLKYAAKWAGIKVTESANYTSAVIRAILTKMLSGLRTVATQALVAVSRNIGPMSMTMMMSGGWALASATAL